MIRWCTRLIILYLMMNAIILLIATPHMKQALVSSNEKGQTGIVSNGRQVAIIG